MKQISLVVVVCLCALLLLAAAREGDRKRDHKPKWGKRSRDEISIQKCKNVVCADGKFCFNGRCKKVDYGCINKKCEKGFRCNKGECVKQKCEPKRQFCQPLGFSKPKLHCGENQKLRCSKNKTKRTICGYSWGGVFQECQNECNACLMNKVQFYYEGSCAQAPKVCSPTEQCLNGQCSQILDERVYQNNRNCNQNQDCKVSQQCAGHKCIKKEELLAYLKTVFQAGPIVQTI